MGVSTDVLGIFFTALTTYGGARIANISSPAITKGICANISSFEKTEPRIDEGKSRIHKGEPAERKKQEP